MRFLPFTLIMVLCLCTLRAQSPHGNSVEKYDCADCHQATSWAVSLSKMTFSHQATSFPLVGQHKSVACRQCHQTLVFDQAKPECYSCHKDIHKNSVSAECSRCHTPQSWVVTNTTQLHQVSRFALLGQHSRVDCNRCHAAYANRNFEVPGVNCYDCHAGEYQRAKKPDHAAARFSTDCQQCHSVSGTSWGSGSFTHAFFPLTGAHAAASCFSCHKQNVFTGLSQDCYGCHSTQYNTTRSPAHAAAGFNKECKTCHTTAAWKPAAYDHTVTGFALTGRHTAVSCGQCHASGYVNTSAACNACHNQHYLNTRNPNHSAAGFPLLCNQCHTASGWAPASFDHDAPYFPIYSGKHRAKWSACSDCHTNNATYAVFSCITCHEHNKTTMDNEHRSVSGYIYRSEECFSCHPRGTEDGAFNHGTSNFPLTGAHITTECSQCHTTGYAVPPPIACYDCHQADFTANTNPDHRKANFSHQCTECHATSGWKPSSYNHTVTGFVLEGKHVTTACNKCHATQYANTPEDCYSCHAENYRNVTNPNHVTSNFPHDCRPCHSQTAFKPANFDHNLTTFPLTGAHTTAQCLDCHTSGYTGTSKECKTCHQPDYQRAANPNHTAAAMPQICSDCHSTAGWVPGTFNHASTGFVLTGKHAALPQCSSCHQGTVTGASGACASCHSEDFNQAQNPSHSAAGLPNICSDCHTTTAWIPGTFDHATTGFNLTGKHATLPQCSSCHAGSVTNTANTCVGCHQSNYNQAVNPNHVTLNLSVNCGQCHQTGPTWKPATFPVHDQYFVITGAHISIKNNCSRCHTTGTFSNTPNVCQGCHMANFNNTTNPNHVTAQFPVDCKPCHTQTAWRPATYNHDTQYFKIYSGKHRGRWTRCSECHQNATNFQVFQCTTSCHPQASMNNQHRNVSGYSYVSSECYRCHRNVVLKMDRMIRLQDQ